jgi:DNA-binding Lrp family transcriptional regulator
LAAITRILLYNFGQNPFMTLKIDPRDSAILDALRRDARKTVKQLARELEMPRSTVHDRIQRMEREKVIRQYTVVPDWAAVGRPIEAFVFVSYDPHEKVSQKDVARKIAGIPGVDEVHIISGEWDLLLRVRGESIGKIGDLVVDRLRALKGVGKTITCTNFLTVKE